MKTYSLKDKINWGYIAVGERFIYKDKVHKITAVGWSKDEGYYVELKGVKEKVYESNIS